MIYLAGKINHGLQLCQLVFAPHYTWKTLWQSMKLKKMTPYLAVQAILGIDLQLQLTLFIGHVPTSFIPR